MQKSEFISKIKNLAKKVYAEKTSPLASPKEIEKAISKFPVLDQFPPLKDIMDDLFDFQYEPFVSDIQWVAPRPTTFRIKLVNGADFYLTYQGKDQDKALFIAQVAGKKYFLESLPEEQQAAEAIARLLRYQFADTGKSTSDVEAGLDAELGDESAAAVDSIEPETPAEEPAAEPDLGLPATVDDL
jgi:hypothetical protein